MGRLPGGGGRALTAADGRERPAVRILTAAGRESGDAARRAEALIAVVHGPASPAAHAALLAAAAEGGGIRRA